jgi:hypothetical protein
MSESTTTWLIIIAALVALYLMFFRKRTVLRAGVGVVQPTKPSVSVNGTTVSGGIANSGLVQAGVLGLAAAPAIGGLFSGLFSSAPPAVAGNAPATGYDDGGGYYDDSIFGSSATDETGMDLLG